MASREDSLGSGVEGGLEGCVGHEYPRPTQEHCRLEERLGGGLRVGASKAKAEMTGNASVRLGNS